MTTHLRLKVTGHYAGAISRTAATVLDIGIILGAFAAGVAGLNLIAELLTGSRVISDRSGVLSVVTLVLWAFVYVYLSLVIAGRTPGKTIVGLRVVAAEGSPLSGREALVRTLVFPLSVLPFGLGFAGIIVQREHRALHDLIAGTAVVYDWGDRSAELPGPLSAFLTRRGA